MNPHAMHRASLPEYCLITPEPRSGKAADRAAFVDILRASLTDTPMLVQLRAKSLDRRDFTALASDVIACCRAHGTRVILNGAIAPDEALTLGADGIHLGSAALQALNVRPLPARALLSAACHTLQDVRQAEMIGADCVTLSPVLPTLSHPGALTLGWERFADWAARTRVPVYALGGMTRAHLPQARACGAQGIAAIRGLWAEPASSS